mgnify:CR=1 FL=1
MRTKQKEHRETRIEQNNEPEEKIPQIKGIANKETKH